MSAADFASRIVASLTTLLLFAFSASAFAGEADVVAATATPDGKGRWTISATVRHADAGWSHYADRWDVVAPGGAVLASRKLLHPHEHEQPFTRSLSAVAIPAGIGSVTVRAHDSVHGYGGAEYELQLPY